MSKITIKEVEALARLARIGLTEEEKKSLALQMSEILDYAAELDKVDVAGIEPTSQVTGLTNIYREDRVVRSEVPRSELLENAPEVEGSSIRVKAVL